MKFRAEDDDGPTAELMWVTPEMATKWLANNPNNRALKPYKIQALVRDIMAGNWKVTGEAIKLTAQEELLDGQNRLRAVQITNKAILTYVVIGVDPDAQSVMDSGTPRSAVDALHLAEYPDPKGLKSAINVWHAWSHSLYKDCMTRPVYRLSHSEVLSLAAEHPGLSGCVPGARAVRRVLPLPLGAIACADYVLSDGAPDDALEFFSRIRDIRTNGPGDPLHTLMKRVNEDTVRRQTTPPQTALFYIFRAWNAWQLREPLTKFQLGSPRRGWAPMPTPILSRIAA